MSSLARLFAFNFISFISACSQQPSQSLATRKSSSETISTNSLKSQSPSSSYKASESQETLQENEKIENKDVKEAEPTSDQKLIPNDDSFAPFSLPSIYANKNGPKVFVKRFVNYGRGKNMNEEVSPLVGYYARPDDLPKSTGIIVLPSLEHSLSEASLEPVVFSLISSGYRVLALDLYAGSEIKNKEDRAKFQKIIKERGLIDFTAHVKAAKEYMQAKLDVSRVAILGIGEAGNYALGVAFNMKGIFLAAASFYGDGSVIASQKQLPLPVFILGLDDPSSPIALEDLEQMKASFANTFPRFQLSVFDAQVGFMEPSEASYNQIMAKKAMDELTGFFDLAFKDGHMQQ